MQRRSRRISTAAGQANARRMMTAVTNTRMLTTSSTVHAPSSKSANLRRASSAVPPIKNQGVSHSTNEVSSIDQQYMEIEKQANDWVSEWMQKNDSEDGQSIKGKHKSSR